LLKRVSEWSLNEGRRLQIERASKPEFAPSCERVREDADLLGIAPRHQVWPPSLAERVSQI